MQAILGSNQIDWGTTERALSVLHPEDWEDRVYIWRFLTEKIEDKEEGEELPKSRSRNVSCTYHELRDSCDADKWCESERGYITFHPHDADGHAAKDIKSACILRIDSDGAKIPDTFPHPSLLIKTGPKPDHYQAYYVLDERCSVDACEAVMRGMAIAMGADPSGARISQMFRLPGSPHRKVLASACHAEILSISHDAIYPLSRFVEWIQKDSVKKYDGPESGIAKGHRPGDEYNADPNVVVSDILPEGWVLDHRKGHVEYWRRPGKENGHSASWNFYPGQFYCWSSEAGVPTGGLTKFALLAFSRFNGDFTETSKYLRQIGYGTIKKTALEIIPDTDRPNIGIIDGNDPDKIPDLYREHFPLIHIAKGDWHFYNGCRWVWYSSHNIVSDMHDIAGFTLKPAYAEQLGKMVTQRIRSVVSVQWNRISERDIAIPEGMLDVLTGEIRAHRPEDNIQYIVPADLNEGPPKILLRVMNDWFSDDPIGQAKKNLLQEIAGAVLLVGFRSKSALWMIGGTDTGKTLFLESVLAPLARLVGGVNNGYAAMTLASFSESHGTAQLLGAALAAVSEADSGQDLHSAVTKLLVSGGDGIRVNPKGVASFTYQHHAKFVFSTNVLPSIDHTDDALWNRLLFCEFTRTFKQEEQDKGLPAKLADEMPQIVRWAIDGARRLASNGFMFTDAGGKDSRRDDVIDHDIFVLFFREQCSHVPVGSKKVFLGDNHNCVQVSELWRIFCHDHGIQQKDKKSHAWFKATCEKEKYTNKQKLNGGLMYYVGMRCARLTSSHGINQKVSEDTLQEQELPIHWRNF